MKREAKLTPLENQGRIILKHQTEKLCFSIQNYNISWGISLFDLKRKADTPSILRDLNIWPEIFRSH